MRPSDAAIEMMKNYPMIYGQIDNVLADFDIQSKALEEAPADQGSVQHLIDAMFVWFCAGMTNIMNPHSNFNRKFKMSPADRIEEQQALMDEYGKKVGDILFGDGIEP